MSKRFAKLAYGREIIGVLELWSNGVMRFGTNTP
jgi:hypothetical protein